MLAARPQPMTFEEYLAWEELQEEKHELVDGYPVLRSERWGRDPVTGMAGASYAHNRIAANILRHLGNRLAGSPCSALPSDQKVRSEVGNARYPDVVVECGNPAPSAMTAQEPRVLFEVLSPSNRPGRQMRLIADYQSIPSVQHVVFVEQSRVSVIVWNRNDGPWTVDEFTTRADACPLPALGVELPLAEIYEGLDLPDA